jgi:tetratricopeptide (TPR) repeat protein
LGSFDAANKEFEDAHQIEPLSLYTNLTVGAAYFYSRQYEKASAQFSKIVEMDSNFAPAHRWLAKTLEQTGKYDEAIAEAQKVIRMGGPSGASKAGLAYAYAVAGRPNEARQVLADLQQASKDHYVSPYSLAAIYAGLGEKDRAFEWLEKDFSERDNSLIFLAVDQQFVNLRPDPRFAELVKKIGIPARVD